MRAPGRRGRAGSGVGAFLTLLAAVLLAPGSTRADCLHPADRPAVGGDPFRLALDGLADESGPLQGPVPKPCSGPECSGESAPSPTSAPAVPPRAKLWALAVEPAPIPPSASADSWPEEPSSRPVRIATSIFHPPRTPR